MFEYLRTTSGHYRNAIASILTPDGQFLVTIGYCSLIVWDLNTGLERCSSTRSFSQIGMPVAINPEGINLITASTAGVILIWDLTTGKVIREFGDSLKSHVYVIISQDWQSIWRVSYQTQIVDQWNLKTGTLINEYKFNLQKCSAATIVNNSILIVAGGKKNTIRMWDLNQKQELDVLGIHSHQTNYLFHSPDNKTLVSSGDSTIKVWNLSQHKLLRTFRGHKGGISNFQISSDWQCIISVGRDGKVIEWDMYSGNKFFTAKNICSKNNFVDISQDKKRLSYTNHEEAIIYNLNTHKQLSRFVISGHQFHLQYLTILSDNKTAFSCCSELIRVWSLETGIVLKTANYRLNYVSNNAYESVCVSGNKNEIKFLCIDNDYLPNSFGKIRVYDLNREEEILTFTEHNKWISSILVSSDNRPVFSGGSDSTIKLWDLETGEEFFTLKDDSGDSIDGLSLNADGTILVSKGHRQSVIVWDLSSKTKISTLPKEILFGLQNLKISPDGQIICYRLDSYQGREMKIWNIQEASLIHTLSDEVFSYIFSPDGKYLIFNNNDGIHFLDLNTKRISYSLKEKVHNLAISNDGKYIVGGFNGNLKIWGPKVLLSH